MKKLIWIGLAFLVVLVGCDLTNRDFYRSEDDFGNQNTGALVLVLDSSAIPTKKTIEPTTIIMDAVAFDISLDYVTNSDLDIDVTNHTGQTYTNYGLIPGTWNIAITAYDSIDLDLTVDDRQVVGAIGGVVGNTIQITIDAGEMIVYGDDEALSIIPIDGTGDLSLDLTWPADTITVSAGVEAYLIPVASIPDFQTNPENYTANELVFTIPASPGNEATYGDPAIYDEGAGATLENDGYYGLFITLNDDTTPVLGIAESVRIITGHESYGNIDLTGETGTLELQWDVDLQNPVGITLTHDDTSTTPILSASETVTVTATLDYPTPQSESYDYEWYVDGVTTGITGTVTDTVPPIEITYVLYADDFTGDAGNHYLSLFITGTTSGVVESLSSDTIAFAVE